MNELDISSLTFAIPARVLRATAQRSVDLLALAKESHAVDPAIFETRAPFFWSAEISSDVIDAYYTHMLMNTLTNFQSDAKSGVSFLPGHRHFELPFGRSLDALLENAADPQRTRVVADFYTLPGLNLNGVSTDDMIDGIRSGILHDVSVGFYGGRFICDVCHRDLMDWDCPHIPGFKYETKEGDVIRTVLATAGVDNARLSEVSSVFDGATPRAEIIKAEREATEGRMRPDAVQLFEARYRVKLPARKTFAGVDTRGKPVMDFEKIVNQLREMLAIDASADLPATVASFIARAATVDATNEARQQAEQRAAALENEATDGRQYRSDLIADALAEGVRAYGEKFDSEIYKGLLRDAPLATIKRMSDDWRLVGDARLPGGRATTDDGEPAPSGKSQRTAVPASSYKV